jgi:hypothetical protein
MRNGKRRIETARLQKSDAGDTNMGGWVTAIPKSRGWVSAEPTGMNPGGSSLRKIRQGDIAGVKCLEFDPKGNCRPVFKLSFRDGSDMVIKMEGSGNPRNHGPNLQWGGKMMRQVTPQLKVQTLERDEIQVLQNLSAMAFATRLSHRFFEEVFEAYAMGGGDGNVWCKMPFLTGLYSAESALKQGGEAAEQLYETLSKATCLRMFGKILAIDLFLGNCDRIDPTTGRVQNSGNIMFQRMGDGQSMMIGLDYYENSGELSNLHGPIPRDWGGEFLRNHGTCLQFANTVVSGLNGMFTKEFGIEIEDFTQGHAWQIANGMQEGIDALHQYFSRRMANKTLPKPILDRAIKLGWYTQQT